MKRLPIEVKQMESGDWCANYECCSAVGRTEEEAEIFLYELIDYVFKDLMEENRKLNENG